jgi:hypothetical protein
MDAYLLLAAMNYIFLAHIAAWREQLPFIGLSIYQPND